MIVRYICDVNSEESKMIRLIFFHIIFKKYYCRLSGHT